MKSNKPSGGQRGSKTNPNSIKASVPVASKHPNVGKADTSPKRKPGAPIAGGSPAPTLTTHLRARGRGGLGWHKPFLAMLRQSCNVTVAAEAAGVNRDTAYSHRKRYKSFAREWDDNIVAAVDLLEASAWQRATRGVKEAIWMRDEKGKPINVGDITRYDSNLHALLLRAHRPEKYRETFRQQIVGADDGPIKIDAPPAVVVILPAKKPLVDAPVDLSRETVNGNGRDN